MSAQTSYSINTDARFHGSLSELQDSEVVSRLVETGEIGFGIAVSRSATAGKEGKLIVLGGADFLGITIRMLSKEAKQFGDPTILNKATESASVMQRGVISLTIPSGGNAGDPLKYNTTTGVIDAGAPGAGEAALPGGVLEQTVAAGVVARCRLSGQV